jgi:3-hydroxyisobutyrate dehydrogenase-like beta-hydroxyacid dehydrogenase
MGSRMAANLAQAGFDVVVWNRTRKRAEETGLQVADTPKEAAEGADAVITMVVDGPQVEEVLFGENGAAEGLSDDALVIDMSTIAPASSRSIAERLAPVRFLDAPVTGSKPKAADGTLTIIVGGDPEDFERARPLFEAMGQTIVHVGPTSHGSMAKLLNNSVAAVNALAIAQAFEAGEDAGLDLEKLLEVMKAGSGASAMLALKGEPMLKHEYETLFKLAHMLKDVRHTLAETGNTFSLAEEAERLYSKADSEGRGDDDFGSIRESVG